MNPSYLRIGDELLSDALLDSVVVTQALNRHWWLEVECRQTQDQRLRFESFLDKPCTLFTYDQNGAEVVTFQGFVLKSQLEYKVYGNYGGKIVAVSDSYKLDLTPRLACYTTNALNTLASQVCGWTGVSAKVQASRQTPPKQYVQWGETDFAFLHRVADDHGAWLRPVSGGLEIFDQFQAGVGLSFKDEFGLLTFDVSGELGQPSFNGAHYDARPMQSQTYTQVAQQPGFTGASGPLVSSVLSQSQSVLPPGYLYERNRVPALADYEQRLKFESARALGSKIVAHGISRELRVKAGNQVSISGPIDAEGSYGVTRAVHRWTKQGYENEFWCTPWTSWIDPEAPSPRKWYGVVPARVVEHSDAASMNRYRIRFYWQEQGEPMLWARMMTPHAGQNRGFFFQPEVGDEVVVAFEDGDPERPIILGCVWNGVDTAPSEDFWGGEYAPNDVKRIITKSGNRIQIVDKPGKQSISLATPNHLKISLFENANETGRSMIQLSNANGDILLSAPNGRIHFHSQYFSREAGGGGGELSAVGGGNGAGAGVTAGAQSTSFLSKAEAFGSGLYDGAVKPLVDTIRHPIHALEGIGHAIAHPIDTAGALAHAVKDGGAKALSGDPYAIGMALGTVSSLVVPGAGEAEAAEDAVRVGQVGKLAEASEAADVAKVAETADAAKASQVLDANLINKIRSTPKGLRPDPAEYLSPEYISAHLAQFDQGATRFMTKSNLAKYGVGQRDGTAFVMPKREADALIAAAKGDPSVLEQSLGLPEGFLSDNEVVRVDIPNPRELNLRMPSGNEAGANEQWVPGGKLPNGNNEAVVDLAGADPTQFRVNPCSF